MIHEQSAATSAFAFKRELSTACLSSQQEGLTSAPYISKDCEPGSLMAATGMRTLLQGGSQCQKCITPACSSAPLLLCRKRSQAAGPPRPRKHPSHACAGPAAMQRLSDCPQQRLWSEMCFRRFQLLSF